eukprot:6488896-Amphidinium_carterae.1
MNGCESVDLRANLHIIGRCVLPFQYLAFDIAKSSPRDFDPDTEHGSQVRNMIIHSVWKLDRLSPIARLRMVVVFPDLVHMIMVVTPLYDVSPVSMAYEIADDLNEAFVNARTAEDAVQQELEVNVHEPYCGGYAVQGGSSGAAQTNVIHHVRGGMFGMRAGTNGREPTLPQFREHGEDEQHRHILQNAHDLAALLARFRRERRQEYIEAYRPFDDLFDGDTREEIIQNIQELRRRVWQVAIDRAHAPWSPPHSLLGHRTPNLQQPLLHSRPETPRTHHVPSVNGGAQEESAQGNVGDLTPTSGTSSSSSSSSGMLRTMRMLAGRIGYLREQHISREEVEAGNAYISGSGEADSPIQNEYSLYELEKQFWDLEFQEIIFGDQHQSPQKRLPYFEDERDCEDAHFQLHKLRVLMESLGRAEGQPQDVVLVGTSIDLLTDHIYQNSQDLEILSNIHDDEGEVGDPIPPPRDTFEDYGDEYRSRMYFALQDLRARLVQRHPGFAYWIQYNSPLDEQFVIGGGKRARSQASESSEAAPAKVSVQEEMLFSPVIGEPDSLLTCAKWIVNTKQRSALS